MPIAKITGQGLSAIAVSVAMLWTCVIGEHLMVRQASTERVRVLQQLEQLQHRRNPVPVTSPLPGHLRRSPLTVG